MSATTAPANDSTTLPRTDVEAAIADLQRMSARLDAFIVVLKSAVAQAEGQVSK